MYVPLAQRCMLHQGRQVMDAIPMKDTHIVSDTTVILSLFHYVVDTNIVLGHLPWPEFWQTDYILSVCCEVTSSDASNCLIPLLSWIHIETLLYHSKHVHDDTVTMTSYKTLLHSIHSWFISLLIEYWLHSQVGHYLRYLRQFHESSTWKNLHNAAFGLKNWYKHPWHFQGTNSLTQTVLNWNITMRGFIYQILCFL